MDKYPTEKKRSWWADMGENPSADFLPFYESGRCQNASDITCPYCGHKHDSCEYESYSSFDCYECEREFRIDANFGYGFSTYPKICKDGNHNYVFVAQYGHKETLYRLSKCLKCEDTVYHTKLKLGGLLLPWLDEYDDPDHFDPEGILKSDAKPKETPVLDMLQNCGTWRGYRTLASESIETALSKHNKIYGEVQC